MLKIHDAVRIPLYAQIYLVLKQEIEEGRYDDSHTLPSEADLVKRFGVSRITAKRALNELKGARLVVRQRGRGTLLSRPALTAPLNLDIRVLRDDILALGRNTGLKLLDFSYVPAGRQVAGLLGIKAGDKIQRTLILRSHQKKAFSLVTNHVPADIGQRYVRQDAASTPMLPLLESVGIKVTAAEQSLSATLASPETARHLGIAVGAPLVRIDRVLRDEDGRAIDYLLGLYRPDLYQYRMRLTRLPGSDERWAPASA